jgi:hypothetical protein
VRGNDQPLMRIKNRPDGRGAVRKQVRSAHGLSSVRMSRLARQMLGRPGPWGRATR